MDWDGIWRAPRERRGGCIGFNRAKTLCKLVVRKTGLAIAGVEQERGNPVAMACLRLAGTAPRGLMACPGPALLHLPVSSSSLKSQGRALPKLELAQSHQHSTQQGLQEGRGLRWH